jgi:hypothetical protein
VPSDFRGNCSEFLALFSTTTTLNFFVLFLAFLCWISFRLFSQLSLLFFSTNLLRLAFTLSNLVRTTPGVFISSSPSNKNARKFAHILALAGACLCFWQPSRRPPRLPQWPRHIKRAPGYSMTVFKFLMAALAKIILKREATPSCAKCVYNKRAALA